MTRNERVSLAQSPITIAVAASHAGFADRLRRVFVDRPVTILEAESAATLASQCNSTTCDVVFVSPDIIRQEELHLEDVISTLESNRTASQIILIAEQDVAARAAESLSAGAYQYVKLPLSDDELRGLVDSALQDRTNNATQKTREHAKVTDVGDDTVSEGEGLGAIVGRSPAMQVVYKQIRRAASVDIPILLLGETGTGKDLIAQTIHQLSSRSDGPFVAINLGSLPSELVASELFGHEKGSFSGAINRHEGVFERGDSGTVLLDEIDCIDEKVRVSLLRLIEQRKFRRLGGKDNIQSNARLIAASNADLQELAEKGEFRKDLFYRLDVFRITVPPLRDRHEDIPLLTELLVDRYAASLGRKITRISPEFMQILQGFDWPGNVRELKNSVQRAVLVCDESTLLPDHLPPRFLNSRPSSESVAFSLGTPLDEIERVMVIRALEATKNNRKRAAELLGISRRVIYNKLRKHNIE